MENLLPPTQGGVYNSKCEMNSDCLKTKKERSSRGINYDALSLSSSTLVETFLNLIEEKGDYKRGCRIPWEKSNIKVYNGSKIVTI